MKYDESLESTSAAEGLLKHSEHLSVQLRARLISHNNPVFVIVFTISFLVPIALFALIFFVPELELRSVGGGVAVLLLMALTYLLKFVFKIRARQDHIRLASLNLDASRQRFEQLLKERQNVA